jgi:fatty acid-binding protein DegV
MAMAIVIEFFVVFLTLSSQMSGQYVSLNLDHERFLPNPFQFIYYVTI